jgi:hypothetical protein
VVLLLHLLIVHVEHLCVLVLQTMQGLLRELIFSLEVAQPLYFETKLEGCLELLAHDIRLAGGVACLYGRIEPRGVMLLGVGRFFILGVSARNELINHWGFLGKSC